MLRSISFHPSGDFLLVGTQHPTLRLYDVNTFQCFVSCNPLDQHTDTISGVSYNPSANSYVTCSKDGSIKLWDGVSNRCVTTFEKAHDGAEVCSAVFSKNSKYVLSSGKDSVVKLWEISTGRTLVKYTGEDDVLEPQGTGRSVLSDLYLHWGHGRSSAHVFGTQSLKQGSYTSMGNIFINFQILKSMENQK